MNFMFFISFLPVSSFSSFYFFITVLMFSFYYYFLFIRCYSICTCLPKIVSRGCYFRDLPLLSFFLFYSRTFLLYSLFHCPHIRRSGFSYPNVSNFLSTFPFFLLVYLRTSSLSIPPHSFHPKIHTFFFSPVLRSSFIFTLYPLTNPCSKSAL